ERQRRLAAADGDVSPAAAELSEALLSRLPAPAATRLILVAHRVLHYVPLAAPPLPQARPGAPRALLSRYEIVSPPSPSLPPFLRSERGAPPAGTGKTAVFADPVFDKQDIRVQARLQPGRAAAAPARRPGQSLSAFTLSGDSLNLFRPGLPPVVLPRLTYTRD